jgi:hypothetical protein
MPGALARTHSLTCEMKKAHERSHHRYTAINRHSPRDGFNAYSVLSPVTGLFCHRHRRIYSRQLDASVGASGPHGFVVRNNAARLASPSRPSHPASTSVTIAIRPSCEDGMAGVVNLICPTAKAKYFWLGDWTTQITLNRLSKLQFWRTRFPTLGSRRGQRRDRAVPTVYRQPHPEWWARCALPTLRG